MAPDRGDAAPKVSSRAWEALNPPLSQWILDATASMNFTNMTPVQASTIPLFLGHKDVVVEAVTGSGKTLTFLIPLVERVLRLDEPNKKHHLAAIVISPTRELAQQIYQVLTSLLAFHPPSAAALRNLRRAQAELEDDQPPAEEEEESQSFPPHSPTILPQLLLGGTATPAQDLSAFLKFSPNVLIATPGRLLEILSSPYVHAPQSTFDLLILDEADRLLDLGFKDCLTRILSLLPKQRRTGLFSASVSEALDQIIRVGLRNPVRVAVKVKGSNGIQDKKTPASLKMTYLVTPTSHKFPAISQLLHTLQPSPLRTIIYLSTCASVDYFQHLLPAILPPHTTLIPLHGKHPSSVRQKNFTKFISTPTPTILLTTDVAARGLDIPQVDLVIQPDPPSDPKVFIHRCGRAGRAGRRGLSVILLTPGREEDYIAFLEVRKTPVEPLTQPTINVTPTAVLDITAKFRQMVLGDRAIHDKAQRAFPSAIQAYSKHQASSIFRLADLDWNDLVRGWALLRIPKMPELRKWKGTLDPLPDVDWDEFRYKEKQREKLRRETMANPKPDGESADKDRKRKSTDAWSLKTDLKEHRETKRNKRAARKAHGRAEKMTDEEKRKEDELNEMIQKVRQQNLAGTKDDDDTFEGFG